MLLDSRENKNMLIYFVISKISAAKFSLMAQHQCFHANLSGFDVVTASLSVWVVSLDRQLSNIKR